LLYEKFKKNDVGVAEAYLVFVGESVIISSVTSVMAVVYYLPQKTMGLN
jgi:hypothetical protein